MTKSRKRKQENTSSPKPKRRKTSEDVVKNEQNRQNQKRPFKKYYKFKMTDSKRFKKQKHEKRRRIRRTNRLARKNLYQNPFLSFCIDYSKRTENLELDIRVVIKAAEKIWSEMEEVEKDTFRNRLYLKNDRERANACRAD